jgi:hypothetical protein
VAVLIRILIFLTIFTSFVWANNYTYLVDEYTKETELEAEIVVKIAKDIMKDEKITLYIPNSTSLEKTIYSKKITLVDSCKEANFIFIKSDYELQCPASSKHFILTNNYRKLRNNNNFIGAFFWSKSRPNIVLVEHRLAQKNIVLPNEYRQFIEDWK